METILYMATSLDGFISRQNGGEDFLSSENWEQFTDIAEKAGCFVVGRKTYEVVKEWDNHSYEDVEAERLVLSNKENYEVDENFTLVDEVEEAVQIAKNNNCDLVVTGGSEANSSFSEKQLIDRFIINVEPVLIGQGHSILADKCNQELKFVRMSRNNSILTLEYVSK